MLPRMSLAQIRHQLHARAAALRLLGLCLLLAMVASGWPQWQIHAHTGVDADHAALGQHPAPLHPAADQHHADHDPLPAASADTTSADPMLAHVHEMASVQAGLPSFAPLPLLSPPPTVWRLPFAELAPRDLLGSPPHRPPIA